MPLLPSLDHKLDTLSHHRWAWLPYAMAWGLLGWVLVRTAWVCDDAYITFRVVDNVLDGYGATWNPGERVQVYTHPLWMLIHIPLQAILHNVYAVTMLLSLGFAMAGAFVAARRLLPDGLGLAMPLLMVSSKAMIEYSTSGLENPLSHFLIMLLLAEWFREDAGRRRLGRMSLLVALLLLCRLDFGVLAGPLLVLAFWRERSGRALGQVALGLLPFLLWEAFSVVYYGFAVPNAAFAKLGARIPADVLWAQGLGYLKDSLIRDPVSLPLILGGMLLGAMDRRSRVVVLGMACYLIYVVRIGGDFMSGRFLAALVLMGIVLLLRGLRNWRVVSVPVAAAGMAASLLRPTPMVLSGSEYDLPRQELIGPGGVADERAFYYVGTGLLRAIKGHPVPEFPFLRCARSFRDSEDKFIQYSMVGMFAYTAGPEKYIIDPIGLANPLYAHLPALYRGRYRAGHYYRATVDGYEQTLAEGRNVIEDPEARELYTLLKPVISGALFSAERWRAIWKLNFGPSPIDHPLRFRAPFVNTFQLPVPADLPFEMPGQEGVAFRLPPKHGRWLQFKLEASSLDFHVVWLRQGSPMMGSELSYLGQYRIPVPPSADVVAFFPNDHLTPSKIRGVAVE